MLQDKSDLDRLPVLEQPDDTLHRATAGVRAATLNKLLFAENEAAIVLGCSTETLKAWRRDGRPPRWVRLGNKFVRYTLDDLQKFASSLKPDGQSKEAATGRVGAGSGKAARDEGADQREFSSNIGKGRRDRVKETAGPDVPSKAEVARATHRAEPAATA